MKILITGGTGFLGQALVRYYLSESEHTVIVFSRDEWKQAQMRDAIRDPRVEFFLGDVREEARLDLAFQAGVQVVLHAAALKRVDSVCHDPDEVFKTNVLGTRNVLHAARRARVGRVVLVSSDKACYPTNAYGVSKAMAEQLTIGFNVYGYPQGVRSSVVRYGNVLGSRGSVVDLWRAQDARGEALTITDPEMTRFLLSVDDAVDLIQTALIHMQGGEIFVPQLPAALMIDLARAVVPQAAGHTYTGKRPGGEKLHETLITLEESERTWDLGQVSMILPEAHPWRGPLTITAEATRSYPFTRRSDLTDRLTVDDLKAMLEGATL